MGSKGSTLNIGDVMVPGDYLQSDEGNSRLACDSDGLNLYWLTPNFPGYPYKVWASGLSATASSLYLVMQADGNLCCYAGSPSSPGPLLWQCGVAPGAGPTYQAVMQNDGNFCVNAGPLATWCAGCAKTARERVVVAGIMGRRPSLFITAHADSSDVTMQEAGKGSQVFQPTDLVVNNQRYGTVLTDTGTGRVLGAWPDQFSNVMLFNYITDYAILIKVDPGIPVGQWIGLRPRSGGNNHFNVPGDGPYSPGSKVIMYHWDPPPTPNMLWEFDPIE